MLLVTGLTSDANQKQTILLPDGSSLILILVYKPLQIGWFIENLTYQNFEINNVRLVTSPNILNQYRNQIPFGLGLFVQDNQEATLQQDFTTGRAHLYLLTSDEVTEFAEILSGQVRA